MTERTSPFDPSSPPPPRRAPPLHAGDSEFSDVVERATRVRDGLALLRSAPLECAAVLLGAAPPAIERARASLEEPGVLEHLAPLFAGAAGQRAVATRQPRPPAPRDPEQLIDAARQRADGLSLLLLAAPEAAAIAFGVHPDLVHDAREVAARRADLSRN